MNRWSARSADYRYGSRHSLGRRFFAEPPRYVSYPVATRHPWPCLLFLLPLLLAYEVGIFWIGGTQPEALRNGADTWLRWGLEAFGLSQLYAAPLLVVGVFLVASWLRWDDRPPDWSGACLGMGIESVIFALLLWGLSRGFGPLIESLKAQVGPPAEPDSVALVITYVGAGIYEEVLFRLVLYSGLVALLRLLGAPGVVAMVVSAVVSATLFSAAHHIGPYGAPFEDGVFLFRALAGLYFAALYQLRGFGIAVGAHACYDVLVGVAVG